jgi:hypothetical protein
MQQDQRSFFEQLRELPVVASTEVIAEWIRIAQQREPWRSMPLDDLLGELSGVASALLQEVPRHDDHQPSILELIARSHGCFRRRQSVAAFTVAEEAGMLGDALRGVLLQDGVSESMAEGVVEMFRRDLRLIRRTMCAGYSDGPSCERR